MPDEERRAIAAIGSIYVETNFIGLVTGGNDSLQAGREYRSPRYEVRLGGSVANFSLQAKLLGTDVGLVGKIGNDESGKKLLSLLADNGISSDLVTVSDNPTVTTCIDSGLVLAHTGENIQVVSGNANQMLSVADIHLTDPYFDSVGAVYLGGFLKQESLYTDYPDLIRSIREKGMNVFFDHGRIPVDLSNDKRDVLIKALPLVDVYLPNEDELLGISGQPDIVNAAKHILELGVALIVVKRGDRGCRVFTATEDIEVPVKSVQAISTVGAGDAFNAGFVTSYLAGMSLKESAEIANTVAAIRVGMNMNPTIEQVTRFRSWG